MKKQFMHVVNTNLFSKFFKTTIVIFMLSTSVAAETLAGPVFHTITGGVGKAEITHVASNLESMYFDVKVDNADGEKFSIIIKDESGSTLYRGSFKDKLFSKRFRLPKADSDKITFSIISSSGTKKESFEINTTSRVIEEVVVTRVGE